MSKPNLLSTAVALAVSGSLVATGAVLAQAQPDSAAASSPRVYMESTGQGTATALAPINDAVTRADVAAARAGLPARADRN